MSTPYAYIEISSYIGEAERQTIEQLINVANHAGPHPVAFHGNMTCWFHLEPAMTLGGGHLVDRTKPLITANFWNDRNVPPDGSRPATEPDIVMIADYHEVFWTYEWELLARIGYLQSGQCGTLATLVRQGQLTIWDVSLNPSEDSPLRGRSATVEITAPDEWDPARYYAGEYVDVTDIVALAQTDMWQITAGYRKDLLNTHWYYPLQFLATRELAYVAIGTDGCEYETWYGLARGWRSDLIDLTDQLPNYEPHVLLCSQCEEFEADDGGCEVYVPHRLYVRADLLKQPEIRELRNASVKWKLSQDLPDERS